MAGVCWLCGGVAEKGPFGDKAATGYRCGRCGRYAVSWPLEEVEAPAQRLRQLASIQTRAASDRGSPAMVTTEWFSDPEAHGLVALPVTAKLQNLLLVLARRSSHLGDLVKISNDDAPLVGALADVELLRMLSALREAGNVTMTHGENPGHYEVTAKGWEEVERLERPGQGRQVFVAMWFDPIMDEAWAQGFERGIRAAGLDPKRVDKIEHINKIDDEIIVQIRKSRAVVADVTGQRAGVYFEAGFALGLKLPVIWCCHEDHMKDVHFDTRQFNHIVWSNAGDLREKLERRLRAVLDLP